jgi:hypothetical protein
MEHALFAPPDAPAEDEIEEVDDDQSASGFNVSERSLRDT